MRDRLIELHRRAKQAYFKYIGDMQRKAQGRKLTEAEFNQIMDNICSEQEFTADYLIANGVIVPPCKAGDKVYYIHETYWDKDYKNQVINDNVRNRILKIVERPNHATNLALEILTFDYCFITDWIKGDIFLTKEEAEKALVEKENNNA